MSVHSFVENNRSKQYFSLNKEDLRKHIELFIAMLERNTIIQLNDKEQLIENLALHLTPAYYRIRYGLTSDYTLTDIVKNQLDPLFFIVKSSVAPLEDFLKSGFRMMKFI